MQRELLDQLISALGARVEAIGEDIQDSGFTGLTNRVEELRKLLDSIEAAEKMRGI
jgi:hypothetical protein